MLILFILFILSFTIILILYKKSLGQKKIQSISLISTVFCFFLSTFFWIFFDRSSNVFQFSILKLNILLNNEIFLDPIYLFVEKLPLLIYINKFFISFGIDGISLFFILLSTFTIPLCLLTSYKNGLIYVKDFCLYLIVLEIFLILSFSALDLIAFFIFFESILIPMFFIIGIWGSRERRIKASFLFFIYTLFGSIFLFFTILILYYDIGTTNFNILSKADIMLNKQILLWFFCYIAFSVKIPTIPFHLWLPEAHVEAPTAGSVILAGLLLKLGGYAIIRVLLIIFSKATIFYLPLTDTLAIISIIYASFTTIRQIDMKKIIAYSSIAHMNLVVLGLFSGNIQGISGSIFLMIAHAIVSSGLFFLIGILYDKYGTRIIYYYGGLVQTMPIFSTLLLIFSLANIGLPMTCNFIGELVVFSSLVDRNLFVLIVATTGVVLSVLYSIFFCNRLIFGNLNLNYISIYKDITIREISIMLPLLFLTFFLGLFPDLIFDSILTSVSIIVEQQSF
jgi:proton-translocating NADH-quinone oxidoreductase chain M